MQDYEKLGVFYLGRHVDPATRKTLQDLFLYPSNHLVTHALCLGMTGSGKTGLGISLIEEAAIDSIPCIVVDPKGDLANLLLTFPDLSADDFTPWVLPEEAEKLQMPVEQYAGQQAQTWKQGLEQSHQSGERIRRLKEAASFTVYTPGSNSARNLSLLSSLTAPDPRIVSDEEAFREQVESTVASLLVLLSDGENQSAADESKEAVLLSSILQDQWIKQRPVEIPRLLELIQ
jgi:hypothetical protein